MKKKLVIVAVFCMSIWLLTACGAEKENVEIIPSTTPNAEANPTAVTIMPTEVPATPTEVPVTLTPEPAPTEVLVTPTPEATPTAVPRIVEGYDIGAATSGTALKDAFADYFKIGTALNGAALETGTLRSEAMTEITKYHFTSPQMK